MKIRYTSLAFVAAFMLSAGAASALVDDAAHYWAFDDASGRTVSDTRGSNGTLIGASQGFGWASGVAGAALGMAGVTGDRVELPDGFLKGSQGSISVWFKVMDMSDRNVIFSGRSLGDNYVYAALMIDHDGRPQLQFRTSSTGNDQKAQADRLLNKNEWYHVVLTADTFRYHMYINGEEVSIGGDNVGRWIPDLSSHTFQYRVGSLDSVPLTGAFNGYVDELRIYDRALTLDDVASLYNGGAPGTPRATLTTPPVAQTPAASVPATEVMLPSGGATAAGDAQGEVANTVSPSSNGEAAIRAQIEALIKQIVALIAELQAKLAEAKSGQAS